MKLDLKLLCMALGLVLCLGENAQVTPCDHDGTTTDKKCQGKRGGTVALKAHGTSTGPVKWKKEASPQPIEITPTKGEYEKNEPNDAVLKILNLKGTSEGKYMTSGGGISPAQNFIVEVADCFGAATDVTCDGKPNGELWLKAIGANTATVTWKKEGTPPTVIENIADKYQKTGAHDSTLKILKLDEDTKGTYEATEGGITPTSQKFKVQVPATSANAGEGNSGVSATNDSNVVSGSSGGKGNSGVSATNDSNVVSNNKGSGDGGNGGRSGSGNGLSYSPALLVIVTLVQLLLQLAN
ncbi:uncharacterized protein [Syngnathus scovelli]|uniref:uncharacterized protein n=1 Tax=Syngnathus scovelli TaxID=161590 RepID=UPI00211053CE|nr:uncharacterized protein LOC125971981 [Syngnathus scovelli]